MTALQIPDRRPPHPLLVLLALVVALLLAGFGRGAPVPSGPKALTRDLLAGTWHYEYGDHRAGTIWLYPDGTYCACHVPGGSILAGDWWCAGATLTLSEWSYTPDLGRISGPTRYEFRFDVSRFPTLAGESNGTTRVVLARPRR